jgi:molecular chaperone HscB
VDGESIKQQHRDLSKKLHPDKWRNAEAVQRRMSLQWMSLVNEAKKVLLDDTLRARYLATNYAYPDERTPITLSPDFLESIFQLQMSAMDPENHSTVLRETEMMLSTEQQTLLALFHNWEKELDSNPQHPLPSTEIIDSLAKQKYAHNLLEKLRT